LARLRAQLAAAEKCEDYELVGTLGEQLVTAPHPLSEEDYLTLADRHEALVQEVTTACQELTKAKAYADVKVLGAVLKELKSLDVSGLPLTRSKNDHVYMPPAAPVIAAKENADDPKHVRFATDVSTATAPAKEFGKPSEANKE
jgi:hypothetical protein